MQQLIYRKLYIFKNNCRIFFIEAGSKNEVFLHIYVKAMEFYL
jgi:hypothetical protein